jgi:hypothetical protein
MREAPSMFLDGNVPPNSAHGYERALCDEDLISSEYTVNEIEFKMLIIVFVEKQHTA